MTLVEVFALVQTILHIVEPFLLVVMPVVVTWLCVKFNVKPANQKLVEASARFASDTLLDAHMRGKSLTDPSVLAAATSNARLLLEQRYAETVVKAGALPDDLARYAASGTATAVAALAPVLSAATNRG